MDFTIYSMGDPAFLKQALLGLSHTFKNGQAPALAKIALMITLLGVLWNGVWNPGKIEFKNFFISFFVVFIMFSKNVDVTLHSPTGEVQRLPEIPIGIAAPAWFATSMGYNLANDLRMHYTTAVVAGDRTDASYNAIITKDPNSPAVSVVGNGLEPLRELLKLKFDGNVEAYMSTGEYTEKKAGAQEKDYSQSITNYIKDCVLKDEFNARSNQEANTAKMYTSPFAWDHMKVSYDGWTTRIKVTDKDWETKGCGAAYDMLNAAMNDQWKPKALGDNTIGKEVNEAAVSQGLRMLGQMNGEAWQVKVNQLMEYHYKKAKTEDRYASQAQLMASQVEFEAIDKRRVSSALGHSSWSEMAIPLITYIEAFVYLIGPLMPFVAGLGEKGVGMVLKYFFLLVWVNTWPILQVGVNMYLQTYINQMTNIKEYYAPTSWAGFNTTFTELESFISMGSTLQTMVPALSLMVLYGSVHTAINLSNKAQSGGGGGDAGAASPTAAAPAHSGKAQVGSSSYTYDHQAGGMVNGYTGSGSVIGSKNYNTNSNATQAFENAASVAREQASSAGSTLAAGHSEIMNTLTSMISNKGYSDATSSGSSLAMQSREALGEQVAKSFGISDQEAANISMAAHGQFGLDAQLKAAAILSGFYKSTEGLYGQEKYETLYENEQAGRKWLSDNGIQAGASLGFDFSANAGAGARAQLDTSFNSALSKAKSKGENWSFTKDAAESGTFARMKNINEAIQKSGGTGWGEQGNRMVSANKAYTEATKRAETLSEKAGWSKSLGGGVNFNLSSAISNDSRANMADDRIADGSLMSNTVNNSVIGSMNKDQRAAFDKFKSEGGFKDNGTALQKFAGTKDGAFLKPLDEKGLLKSQDDWKADYAKTPGAQSNSIQDQREAAVRYAGGQLDKLISLNGNAFADNVGFITAANMLDNINQAAGGNMRDLSQAANDIRKLAGGPTGEKLDQQGNGRGIDPRPNRDLGMIDYDTASQIFQQLLADAKVLTSMQLPITEEDLRKEYNENAKRIKANQPENTTLQKEGEVIKNKAEPVGNKLDLLNATEGGRAGLLAFAPVLTSALNAAGAVAGFLGTSKQESVLEKLEQKGVDERTAKLMAGFGTDTAHSEINRIIGDGAANSATTEQKLNAARLLSAADASREVIKDLEKTGSPQDKKIAETLRQNVNSVENAFNKLKGGEGNQPDLSMFRAAADAINEGNFSNNANYGFMKLMDGKEFDVREWMSSTNREVGGLSDGASQRGSVILGNDQGSNFYLADAMKSHELGKATLEKMKERGESGSENYKELQNRVEKLGDYLDDNKGLVAGSIALQSIYGNPDNKMSNEELAKVSGFVRAVANDKLTGFENKTQEKVLNESERGFMDSLFGDFGKNVKAMESYERMRPALEDAAERLKATPGFEDIGTKLEQSIERIDHQLGFSQREATALSGDLSFNGTDKSEVTGGKIDQLSVERFESAMDGQKFSLGDGGIFTKETVGEGSNATAVLRSESGEAFTVDASGSLSKYEPDSSTAIKGSADVSSQSGGNVNSQSGSNSNEPVKADGKLISSTFGSPDEIQVSMEGFAGIHAAENGTAFEIAGETFTKTNSTDSNGFRMVELHHEGSGQTYKLFNHEASGVNNLSMEARNGRF